MTDKNKKAAPDTEKILDTHKTGLFARLRGYFIAGIVVTAPISITIYLTYVFLNFVDSNVAGLIPAHYFPEKTVPGLGIVTVLVFFIAVGWLAKNFLGRIIITVSEYIVHRMPVINAVYKTLKQIFETVVTSQSEAFREAVMLEYPRKGVWSIGFVTGGSKGEVQQLTENETLNVFVPTTPNPTSGFLLFVPKKEVKYLDMSVEDAVKLVISAGIVTPPKSGDATSKKKTLRKATKSASPAKKTPRKKAPAKKTTAKK